MHNFSEVEIVFFDFDGVLTDNRVIVNERGEESVLCYRSDGIGLSKLKSLNIPLYIISTEKNPVVIKRSEKLGLKCFNSIEKKDDKVISLCNKHGIDLSKAMFMGNDINDLSVLKIVGFPVGVADAFPEILEIIKYKTKKSGGFGAVREICDLIHSDKTSTNEN